MKKQHPKLTLVKNTGRDYPAYDYYCPPLYLVVNNERKNEKQSNSA